MNDEKLNLEIEKIANLMVHDDVSSDETSSCTIRFAIFSISKLILLSSM